MLQIFNIISSCCTVCGLPGPFQVLHTMCERNREIKAIVEEQQVNQEKSLRYKLPLSNSYLLLTLSILFARLI